MRTDEPSCDVIPNCELCEKKLNPTVNLYHDICLCSDCFQHIQNLPPVVANSLERFLIGNVV